MSDGEDNTISEMSLSIRQRLGETLQNKLGHRDSGVNDVGLSGSESGGVDHDDEEEDSDTQRDKLLHNGDEEGGQNDGDSNNDIESGGDSQARTQAQSDDKKSKDGEKSTPEQAATASSKSSRTE
jgi:hypothetical protein